MAEDSCVGHQMLLFEIWKANRVRRLPSVPEQAHRDGEHPGTQCNENFAGRDCKDAPDSCLIIPPVDYHHAELNKHGINTALIFS